MNAFHRRARWFTAVLACGLEGRFKLRFTSASLSWDQASYGLPQKTMQAISAPFRHEGTMRAFCWAQQMEFGPSQNNMINAY